MRRIVALVVLGLALMVPGVAVAKGHYVCHRHHGRVLCWRMKPKPLPTFDESSLRPTAADLASARAVAVAYWQVAQPPCGRESVSVEKTPANIEGEAQYAACRIVLSAAIDWHDFPALLCKAYVHEFGHLTLGPTYFAQSNPTDPAHSPDPASIMYRVAPEHFAPCGADG